MTTPGYDEQKLEAVREYLRAEFPDHQLAFEAVNFDRSAYFFHLYRDGATAHRLWVSQEFVGDTDINLIQPRLQEYKVAYHLKRLQNQGFIFVTNERLIIEETPRETSA